MKKLNTIFFILFTAIAVAQNSPLTISNNSSAPAREEEFEIGQRLYLPMLINSSWTCVSEYLEPPAWVYIYYNLGDTIINSKNYVKIGKANIDMEDKHASYDNRIELFREEVSTRRIYRYLQYNQTEQLEYDFSLRVGDTLPVYGNYVLKKISTTVNLGRARREFLFVGDEYMMGTAPYAYLTRDSLVWIEGIGNCLEPFNSTLHQSAQWGRQVVCVKREDETIYDYGTFGGLRGDQHFTCSNINQLADSLLGTSNESIAASKGYVVPSVTTSTIKLIGLEAVQNVTIYNLNGQMVLQCMTTEIDVSALSAGVYVVQAQTAGGNILQSKFIKQ